MRQGRFGQVLLLVSIAASLGACELRLAETPSPSADDPSEQVPPSRPPDLADSEAWVEVYDPDSAFNGYTLGFFLRRMPILMDMNGRVVHTWPEARVKSRLRLSEQCILLGIGLDRSIVEYDWTGKELWKHSFPGQTPHHEVIWLENGNLLTVLRRKGKRTDDIVEVDRSGKIAWQWSGQRLEPYFGEAASKGDITHINSVQELFDNPWSRGGDDRFRPGNLLVSARNINLVFIIDRSGGEVVWSYDRELDLQHEALMIGEETAGFGNILVFNNGYRSSFAYRQSSVLEIDPVSLETRWKWAERGFYSPTGGIEQPLPNGNILISSSRGGRAFEVTRAGRIVWQWIPPFDPNRPQRYSYDHCPQLVSLDREQSSAVRSEAGFQHIDPDTYRFARRGALQKINIDGTRIDTLENGNDCVSMVLPDAGVVHVGYGLNRRPLKKRGIKSYAVDFRLSLRVEGDTSEVPLMEDRVDLSSESWRNQIIDVGDHAYKKVDLCVSTVRVDNPESDASVDFAYWGNPVVVSTSNPQSSGSEAPQLDSDLTPEELEAQQEHLKALGYLD